ncbi:MAG: aminoacyl-tRNA hydrolase [Lachnospiraceae bacterium]|nr:aminoacyl-tRNA hydrolase [Lachnospiraceae bacterium]
MYVICGLGNPGKEYEHTRHNTGFDTLDMLAGKYGISIKELKQKGMTGKGMINGQKVVLVKPLTFMNASGDCVRAVTDFYKIDVTRELIIIYDDIALPTGRIRVRPKGSAGGHNGVKSIIAQLGTESFPRVRVGVGGVPAGRDQIGHVLGRFTAEDRALVQKGMEKALKAVEIILESGVDEAMNCCNAADE